MIRRLTSALKKKGDVNQDKFILNFANTQNKINKKLSVDGNQYLADGYQNLET